MKRYVVIGGGITGLAAAWRLKTKLEAAGAPFSLLLLEASSYAGTSIQSIHREGFLLETGPDCFISQKPRGVGLAKELGLEHEMIGTRPDHRRSFILRRGRFYPVPEGFYLLGPTKVWPFLWSGLISWKGKMRAFLEPLIPRRKKAVRTTDESLGSFVRRRLGAEMLDWLAQPLVAGIYGADPEALSLRATFPLFHDMEDQYGSVLWGLKKRQDAATRQASGPRYSLFVSFKNGMQTLTDRLVERLGSEVVRKNATVRAITPTKNTWTLTLTEGAPIEADGVVLALPAYAAADLLEPLDPELTALIRPIHYAPAATINIAFRETAITLPIEGIGFVVPVKESCALMGGTFVQNKFDGRAPKGHVLLRAFIGGSDGPKWLAMDDDALTRQVLGELNTLLGIHEAPLFSVLERYPNALPQFALGHIERIQKVETLAARWKNLTLAGNWLKGVGIPDCIASGEEAAETLLVRGKK